MINSGNDTLINLRNAVNKNEIAENENSDNIIDIVKKILEFNKQKKGTGLS